MTIRCEIVSQDRTVFAGDVDIVVLPGAAGEMGILPKHAPVLTTLKFGVIKVRKGGKEEVFTVAGGVAEVQPDIVTVLADAAENVQEIDVARAMLHVTALKKRLPKASLRIMMPISQWKPRCANPTCVLMLFVVIARVTPFALFGTINPSGYVFQRPGH